VPSTHPKHDPAATDRPDPRGGGSAGAGICPLCGRPLIPGPSVDRHHWVPRSKGGGSGSLLHVICHRMIHRLFDEVTLARDRNTPEALRTHPDMARFLAWVRRQPPEYVDWPERSGRHGRNNPGRRSRARR